MRPLLLLLWFLLLLLLLLLLPLLLLLLLVGVLQLHKYMYLLGITCFICGLLTLVTLVLSHPGLPRLVSDAMRCDSIRFDLVRFVCLSMC